ncbi:MAG: hypothetical protein II231_04845 [Rikenellaceae bacterium]|jgi:hypothetical protein|nr:hypothetical protein [Rikenellaceae bacterium]MBQ5921936.1 hypothetical protein [Alistipes sp.]
MSGKHGNFQFGTIQEDSYCNPPKLPDFTKLHEQACSELALQQTKRDQIIHLYTLLFSFLVPLLISLKDITIEQKGWILLATTFIGILLALIVVRYRVYKEAYWLTCIAIVQLNNLKAEVVNKENIQAVYYHCMKKKWGKNVYTKPNGDKKFCHWRIFVNNIFSAESIYYIIIILLTAVSSGLSLYMILCHVASYAIIFSLFITILLFVLLLYFYFRNLERIYRALVDDSSSSFNFAFSKAWFLHFYKD